jgi:hypothetical protein
MEVGGGESTSSEEITTMGVTEATQQAEEDVVNPGSPTIFTGRSFKYPARAVQFSPATKQALLNDKIYDPNSPVEGNFRKPFGGNVGVVYYEGPQLVDVDDYGNKFIRPGGGYAKDGSDINYEYFSITNKQDRDLMFSTAQKLGFYGSNKPSQSAIAGTGFNNTDANALQSLYDYSTSQGVTWKNLGMQVASGRIPTVPTGGSGRTVRVTSTEDIKTSLFDAFFTALGRAPTPEDIRLSVSAIQSSERKAGMGDSMDPTSLGVAARNQARQASPGEAAAVSTGTAIDRMFRLIGGA